ncbi:MAG: nucleotide exchange factor GrpE [Candidatus Electrothrix sp. YB6]
MKRKEDKQLVAPDALVRERLVAFQREIAELRRNSREQEEAFRSREQDLLLSLFEVLDAFDNVERNLQGKEELLGKTGRRLLNNTRAINRKLLRLLRSRQIEPLDLQDSKARMEQCRVVATRPDPERENAEIILVEKKGYVDTAQNQVLRKAEVVTVRN